MLLKARTLIDAIMKLLLLTSVTVDGICLTMIFGHFMMDDTHDVGTNGGLEDSWKADGSLGSFIFLRVNGDERTSRGQRL